MTNEHDDIALYLEERPQITVAINPDGNILISTARIDSKFENCEIHEVCIPLADVRKVGEALIALADRKGA